MGYETSHFSRMTKKPNIHNKTNMMKSFKIEETDALIDISVDDSSVMFPQKWNFHDCMKLGHTGCRVHCIL